MCSVENCNAGTFREIPFKIGRLTIAISLCEEHFNQIRKSLMIPNGPVLISMRGLKNGETKKE